MNYSTLVASASNYWQTAREPSIIVTWNPKAPQLATLKYEVIVEGTQTGLNVFSYDAETGYDFAAYFTPNGVTVGDGHLHTLSHIPPFDVRSGGTTTSLPSEILAVRLLLLANAVPSIRRFNVHGIQELSKEQQIELATLLFPDSTNVISDGTRTTLKVTRIANGTQYEWLDHGGAVFRVESRQLDSATLAMRKRAFEWHKERVTHRDLPSLKSLLVRLKSAQVITGVEGVVIPFTASGPAQTEPARKDVLIELARVRAFGKIGSVSTARAAPVRAKESAIDNSDQMLAVRSVASAELDDTMLFAISGLDWLVSVNIPGITKDEWSRVTAVITAWLRELAG